MFDRRLRHPPAQSAVRMKVVTAPQPLHPSCLDLSASNAYLVPPSLFLVILASILIELPTNQHMSLFLFSPLLHSQTPPFPLLPPPLLSKKGQTHITHLLRQLLTPHLPPESSPLPGRYRPVISPIPPSPDLCSNRLST